MKTSMAQKVVVALFLSLFLVTSAATETNGVGRGKRSNAAQDDCSRVDDAALAGNVNAEISRTALLYGQNIKAEVRKRVVTIRGNVSSKGKKRIAGRIAKHVKCVRSVVNELEVTPPIHPEFTCCCDGECYYSSSPCPPCARDKKCVDDYKAAVREARDKKGDERRKALEAAVKAFYECVENNSK